MRYSQKLLFKRDKEIYLLCTQQLIIWSPVVELSRRFMKTVITQTLITEVSSDCLTLLLFSLFVAMVVMSEM